MYHILKYKKNEADKDLLYAIDVWREEEYDHNWRQDNDLLGSSFLLCDSIIDHIGDLAHYHHLKSTSNFINAVDWVYAERHAEELLAIIHKHVPIPLRRV